MKKIRRVLLPAALAAIALLLGSCMGGPAPAVAPKYTGGVTDKEASSGSSSTVRDDSGGKGSGAPDGSVAKEPKAEAAPKESAAASDRDSTAKPAAATARGAEAGKAKSDDFMLEEKRAPEPKAESMAASPAPKAMAAAPTASGLQAGFADDNKQFNYFVGFLAEYGSQAPHIEIPVQERIVVNVLDEPGKPVANALVTVGSSAGSLASGKTAADGSFLFFPSEYDAAVASYSVAVSAAGQRKTVTVERGGRREVEVRLSGQRPAYQNVPLDILFILDTTGSMGEEIQRLKTTIELINLNLSSLSSKPRVRFGMVLYKDRGDSYVTQTVPLTGDLPAFQKALGKVRAEGGGDNPEDLQAALREAIQGISWDPNGIRLGFIITDAPPHLDYGQEFTYLNAVHGAREAGIKLYSVGTGGLPLAGEIVLRQISQYTGARYIFLTYGEKGEASGGVEGSVSHHSGANFQTDKLEAIIIRFAKEELAFLTDQPLEEGDEFIEAHRIDREDREATLAKLFDMAIGQLSDYASITIPKSTPAAALPIVPSDDGLALNAEYFSEQLVLSLSRNKTFSMVERKDLQSVLKEMELQLSGLSDEKNAARLGQLIGATMLVNSRLYVKDDSYEIFLKLLRVETGEILSVTKLVVDRNLGLDTKK